jgi:hypothetical protein
MEREKEVSKLVNVLRRTARMALQAGEAGGSGDVARFTVEQYNRVLARLKELDPSVGSIFDSLPADSSLPVAGMACRQLAAYYEDEAGAQWRWGRGHGIGIDAESFKEFWQRSARDIEDFGEYIRGSVDEWLRQRKSKGKEQSKESNRVDPEETKPS